jgi:uncharacterized protein YjbI with pentapeptide repeats
MPRPEFLEDEAFRSLRAGDLTTYHQQIEERDVVDFGDADLRAVDLRKADISKVILRGAYLRDADLRGVDLRGKDLEGCTLLRARVSGTFFPTELSAQELRNSVDLGTRIQMTGLA